MRISKYTLHNDEGYAHINSHFANIERNVLHKKHDLEISPICSMYYV